MVPREFGYIDRDYFIGDSESVKMERLNLQTGRMEAQGAATCEGIRLEFPQRPAYLRAPVLKTGNPEQVYAPFICFQIKQRFPVYRNQVSELNCHNYRPGLRIEECPEYVNIATSLQETVRCNLCQHILVDIVECGGCEAHYCSGCATLLYKVQSDLRKVHNSVIGT